MQTEAHRALSEVLSAINSGTKCKITGAPLYLRMWEAYGEQLYPWVASPLCLARLCLTSLE